MATKQNKPFIFEAILDFFEEERKQYMITIKSIHNTLKYDDR